MKKITLSIVSIMFLSQLSFAGGSILPVDEPIVEVSVIEDNSAFYVGIGYSYLTSNRTARLNIEGDPFDGNIVKDTDSTANNLLLQAGYKFNKYFALEGRYTFSAGDHSLTHNFENGREEDVDISISNLAVYLKPMYPIGDFTLYGLLGYGKTEREFNVAPIHTWDESGFQWGAGFQYEVMDNISIFADYTLWYDEEGEQHESIPRLLDTDFSVISIGISYKF